MFNYGATLFLSVCITRSLLSDIPLRTISSVNNKSYCGHFNVSLNKSFDIFDREEHSSALAEIHKTEEHEIFRSVQIRSGCEMKICAFQPLEPERKRICYFEERNTHLDYETFLFIVTTSCSCKQPTPACNITRCENVLLEDNECARIYKEANCSECRYDPVRMRANDSFIPSNSFSTDSFIVQEGCRLSIKSTYKPSEAQPDYKYEGMANFIQLKYTQRPHLSKFSCSCGITEETTSGIGLERISIELKLAATIPVVLGVIIAAVFVRKVIRKHLQNKLSEKAVKIFAEGNQNPTNEEDGQKNNLFSVGYATALQLPYQKRYEIPRENLEVGVEIGKGTFGKVSEGMLQDEAGKTVKVAVKILEGNASLSSFTSILDEIKIMAYLGNHSNIVNMIGACTQNIQRRDAMIVMEFCKKRSLKSFITENRFTFVQDCNRSKEISLNAQGYATVAANGNSVSYVTIKPEISKCLLKWSKEIAAGMEFLSSKQVVHIDLAARNILLTEDSVAKVADFGLSQRMYDVANYVKVDTEYPLPFKWMAIESLKEFRFSIKSDVWSYGITLWEIFSLGEDPYKNVKSYSALVHFLSENQRLPKSKYATQEIYYEVLKCWLSNPDERPSFTELRMFFEQLEQKQ